jgi:hypothetical protein
MLTNLSRFKAHSAEADAQATAEVLEGMLAQCAGLPRDVVGLSLCGGGPCAAGEYRLLRRVAAELRLARGKHRGAALSAVASSDPSYRRWMLAQGLGEDTKAAVRQAVAEAREAEYRSRKP